MLNTTARAMAMQDAAQKGKRLRRSGGSEYAEPITMMVHTVASRYGPRSAAAITAITAPRMTIAMPAL